MTFTGNKEQIQQQTFKLDKYTVYDVKIEKHKNKRGPQANKYAWKLMTEIGQKMILSKEEVYAKMLSDYGIFKTDEYGEIIEGYFSPNTSMKDLGSYWKFIEFVNVEDTVKRMCYLLKGSSEYNSKEMYDFIQGIEQEARCLNIETLEERELRKMIEEMEKYENKKRRIK